MSKIRILLVEDESIVALDLQRHLINYDYDVVGIAARGEAAVDYAEEKCPDLVLMDIQLKGEMDGIQAADIIRERFDIPVIFLTAFDDASTLDRAKSTEAFGYILKPYHEREMHTTIEIALYKHKIEKKLRESERWLDTTLNNIRDCVLTSDQNGMIISANKSARTILGIDDPAGKNIDDLIKRNIRYEEQDGKEEPAGCFLMDADRKIPVELIETELKDEKGFSAGKLIVLHDYSERFAYELALKEAKGLAQRANKVKGDFLATVTHELRTPLNGILGMAEILLEEAEAQTELYENLLIIKNSGNSLLEVINSMLQVIQSGNEKELVRNYEAFPLQELLKTIFDIYAEKCVQKGILFQCALQSPAPLEIFSSRQLILNVYEEILKNAVKFTASGSIILKMTVEDTIQNGEKKLLKTVITDTGAGLPADQLETIFEPFTQVDDIYTRLHGGTGLGLTIAKQNVEILGGSISAKSVEGSGSSFHILIPCSHVHEKKLDEDFILSNRAEKTGKELPRFKNYLLDVKKYLRNNDLQNLELETEKMKEALYGRGSHEYQEVILKILLACRRKDIQTLEKEIEKNLCNL